MDRTTAVVVGVIALVVIGGGLIFYSMNTTSTPSTIATSTPVVTPTPNPSPQPGTPVATTNSSAATTDTTATVNGMVKPNGSFTSYWYEYGTTSNLGTGTKHLLIGSGYVAIPVPSYITGLAKDTTYSFRVAAENQYGTSRGQTYTFRTTHGTPPPVGSAPSAVTIAASGVSRTTANVNGEVTPNKAATQYWFEYGKTANLGNTTAFVSAGDGSAKAPVSLSLSGLDPFTTYYFRLNAQNQFGTVNGSILTFKTVGPPAVAAPSASTESATSVATTTATLRGTVTPNGAETTYWFEYSTDSLLGSVLLHTTSKRTVPANSNMLSIETDISGLASSTAYYFRLVAENSVGTVRGDRASFTTK